MYNETYVNKEGYDPKYSYISHILNLQKADEILEKMRLPPKIFNKKWSS